MKRIYTLLAILIGFSSVSTAQVLTNACEMQPCQARPICGTSTLSVQESYSGANGNPIGTCTSNTGPTYSFLQNWVYFKFTCNTAGILNYTITPNDAASDLDWALYDITTAGCANIGLSNVVECNGGPITGGAATGISNTGIPAGSFEPSVSLIAGHSYILGVSRASGGLVNTGFTINFTGTTANITDNIAPSLATILPFTACSPVTEMKVKMTEGIRCTQIQNSDFIITGNPSYTAAGNNCNGCTTPTYSSGINYSNVTDTLTFTFPTALAPGNYTLSLNNNAFTDICGNFANNVITLPFTVPAQLKDSIITGFNCGTQQYVDTVYGVNGTSPYQYRAIGTNQTGTYGAATASYNVFTNIIGGQSYTFTVKDATGCTADSVLTHPAYVSMSVLTFKKDVPCNNQWQFDTIKVTSVTGGKPPYSFTLAGPGAAAANNYATGSWAGVNAAGVYTITVTDGWGCTKTALVNIINPTVLNLPTPAGTNPQCFGSCTGTITASASGGTFPWSYSLQLPSGFACLPAPVPNTTGAFTGLSNGTYTVLVTDANGCTKTAIKVLTSPPQIVFQNPTTFVNPTCPTPCSGTITPFATGGVGASKKYYLYNPTNVLLDSVITLGGQFQNLCQGSYTMVATDVLGCTNSTVVVLALPPIPSLVTDSTNNVLCNGGCSGKVYTTTSGGTSPYTYAISPASNPPCGPAAGFGTGDFQNLPIGNYSIIITDVNQCKDTVQNINITEPPALTWTSTNFTDALCFGACSGTATVSASGGSGTIVYTIAPTTPCLPVQASSGNFTNLGANTYTIIATDANNCTISTTITIGQPTVLSISSNQTASVTCFGLCNASVTLTPTGGTGAVSYTILPNSPCIPVQPSAGVFNGLGAATYTVTGTDANGCSATTSFTITEPSQLVLSSIVDNNVSCFGFCDGGATISFVGGTGAVSYTISPNTPCIATQASAGVFTGLGANTYTVTGTDANGCSATTTFSITQPAVLNITSTVTSNVSCGGLCDGAALINNTGGTGSVTYSIVGNLSTTCVPAQLSSGSFSNLAANTYTVTGIDANGCTATTSFAISEPPVLSISAIVNGNVLCTGGCDGSATVTHLGGTGAVSYIISPTTPCLPGQATAGIFTNLGANTYTILATDANGCTTTTSFTITEPTTPIASAIVDNNATCNGACDGGATVTTAGGTVGYTYTITPITPCVPVQATPGVFTGLGANTYTVTSNDANGCTTTTTFAITQPALLVLSPTINNNVSCNGVCDGSATINFVGGTPGVSYTITPNTPCIPTQASTGAFTGLGANTYTVTGTDANGCTATTSFTITEPIVTGLTSLVTANVSCNGLCDGSVIINTTGGTGAFTFTISPTAPCVPSQPAAGAFNGLGANTYTVTGTDANGCTATTSFTITEPNALVLSQNALSNALCNASCDGSATITHTGGTGAVSYTISPNTPCLAIQATAGVFTNLGANTYTVVGTDANGCTATITFTITSPTVVAPTAVVNGMVSCNNGCDGSATVTSIGGTPGYTYTIAPIAPCVPVQASAGVFTGLGAATYTVTSTDANGCTATTTFTITQPTVLSVSVAATQSPTCTPGCDGEAQATATGGTPNYTYSILPASGSIDPATGEAEDLCAGVTYTITVTDMNGCTATTTINMSTPNGPTVSVTSNSPASCFSICDGTATFNITNGTLPYTPSISPALGTTLTGSVYSGLCAGTTYTISVTDGNSCASNTTITITGPSAIVPTAVTTNASCFGVCDGTATMSSVGGSGTYTYTSTGGTVLGNVISGLCAGTVYTVTSTDANSCTGTTTVSITEPTQVVLSPVVNNNALCNTSCDGSATVTFVGGTGAVSYTISPNTPCLPVQATSGNFTNLGANTYTVVGTDANGCTGTTTFTITSPTIPAATPSVNGMVSCNGGCDGSATVTTVGGTPGYTYTIAPIAPIAPCVPIQASAGVFTGLGAATYTVTSTDANGCTATTTFTITEPTAHSVTVVQTQSPTCTPGCDGQAQATAVGGTPLYTYSIAPAGPATIDPSTGLATNLCAATTYTITSTDAIGCTATSTIILSTPNGPTVSIVGTVNASCPGICDGTATYNVVGGTPGYTPSISPAATLTGNVYSGLCAGTTYTITISDANTCSSAITVLITEPNAIVPTAVTTDASCFGVCDGTATMSSVGGTPGYTYTSTGGTVLGNVISGLCAGTIYIVTSTDANGCTGTTAVSITEPTQVVLSSVVNGNALCNTSCDGSATVTFVGGTGAVSYTISPNTPCLPVQSTSGNFTNLGANTYTVVGTDANGCTGTTSFTIISPTVPVATPSVNGMVSCNGGCDGSATVTTVGGTPGYTYTIAPIAPCVPIQATAGVFTGLGAATYTVTSTDANGCTATTTFTITQPQILTVNITPGTSPTCQPGCDGTAQATAAGGTATYTYSIAPASGTIDPLTGAASTLCANIQYTVSVIDANGCTASTTFTMTNSAGFTIDTLNSVSPTCNPACNGTISTNITGTAVAPLSYTIDNGAIINNAGDAGNLCDGILYTITVTDANSCSATTAFTLFAPSATPISVTSSTDASCNPGCDGTVTLSPAVGMTYAINPSAGAVVGNVINGLCANNLYTVTGTDAAGCTASTTIQIGTVAGISISVIDSTDASCNPGCDGTVTLNLVAGVTYTINPSAGAIVGNIINGLCANILYTITGSDAFGCTATTTIQIGTLNGPGLTVTSTTNASCNPGCDGTATFTPSGGTAPYTYTPLPPGLTATGNVISGLCSGIIYNITVQDAVGCTISTTVQVGTTPSPTVSVTSSTNVTVAGGSNGSITVAGAGGTPGYTYAIAPNIGLQGPIGTFTGLTAQCYIITVTDSKGCTNTTDTCLTEPGACNVLISNLVNVNCNGQSTGSFTATGAGGVPPFTYAINNGGTINLNTGQATGLAAGNYIVTATDAGAGCAVTTSVTISEPLIISFNPAAVVAPSCIPGCDGTITISATGGTGAITYSIANASAPCPVSQTSSGVFNGVGVATYTITATDANGCTATSSVIVNSLNGPSITGVNVTNVNCKGACNGTITITATGATGANPYSIGGPFQSSNGFTALCANNYVVTVKDANGCEASTNVAVTEPLALTIDSFSTVNPFCNGQTNGTAHIEVIGGTGTITYSIQPGGPSTNTTGNFSGLGSVTYIITATDANSCSITTSFTLNNPSSISWANFSYTNILCAAQSNGTINACATGGTGIISYTLNGVPVTNCNITNLGPNTYTVIATDASGCLISSSVVITAPPILTLNPPTKVNPLCNGVSTGSITTFANGGTPGYTYTINPNNGTQGTPGQFNGLPAGTYAVTVTDNSGCTAVISGIVITQPAPIQFTQVNVQNVACFGEATGSITLSGQGGTGGLSYTISPNVGNQSPPGFISGLSAGTYVVTATDANNCTMTTSVNVTQNPPIVANNIELTEPICNGDANGIIDITASGGVAPLQFALDGPPFQSSGQFNAVTAGNHTITIQDILGCTQTVPVVLTEPLPVGATLDLRDANCVDSKDGKIFVTGIGGRGGYKYYITPGLYINKSGIFNGLEAGTYTLQVMDTAGCEYSTLFTINPPANPLSNTITKLDLACHGKGNEGSATANTSGGKQPYTYLWNTDPVQTTATASTLYFGTYMVEINDANGCTLRDTVYIEEGPCCEIAFIPNAFSPNGDGNNDVFKVLTTAGVDLIQLEIRDRWGNRVWSTSDYRRGWDGTIDGRDAPMETYYYVLKYKCTRDGSNYIKKGDVILVR